MLNCPDSNRKICKVQHIHSTQITGFSDYFIQKFVTFAKDCLYSMKSDVLCVRILDTLMPQSFDLISVVVDMTHDWFFFLVGTGACDPYLSHHDKSSTSKKNCPLRENMDTMRDSFVTCSPEDEKTSVRLCRCVNLGTVPTWVGSYLGHPVVGSNLSQSAH